jgi:hypothetical protein
MINAAFVSQAQEANRKMKRKVVLLAAALARQLGGLLHAGHGRGRGMDNDQHPQNSLTLERK